MRKIKPILIAFIFLLVSGCSNLPEINTTTNIDLTATGTMEIHCIDVGQGDATLIQFSDKNILIDAGENDQGDIVSTYLKNEGVSKIDVIIGTHPHSDHIGGMDTVINNFEIGDVYLPNKIHTSKTYEDVLDAIDNKGLSINVPEIGDTISYEEDGFLLTFLNPASNADYGDNMNAYSLVTMIQFGDVKYLTGGDCDYGAFDDLLASGQNLDADIFHAFHHGSNNHTNTDALKAKVTPTYVIVSVGVGNSYGHPHKETLARFADSKIYRTDESGNIVITISNDGTISFNTTPSVVDVVESSTVVNTESEDIIIGNVNSKKYHKADCGNLPYKKNREYFESEQAAIDAGYEKALDCFEE